MTKLTETLKNAGWVETTLGECQVGDEVLLTPDGRFPRAVRLVQPPERGGEKRPFVITSDGGVRRDTTPVLRPPRPEYEPGTVALIRGRVGKSHVRAWKVPGQWIPVDGIPLDDDDIEVVRVLLPADQDTPAVEVTDEMVERAAETCYLASFKEDDLDRQWDKACERFPYVADLFRREVRATLEAALGVEK